MDKVKPYVIGVDLGGTNTVFGVVNARGEVVGENSMYSDGINLML